LPEGNKDGRKGCCLAIGRNGTGLYLSWCEVRCFPSAGGGGEEHGQNKRARSPGKKRVPSREESGMCTLGGAEGKTLLLSDASEGKIESGYLPKKRP